MSERAARRTAIGAGVIFVLAGLAKFVFYDGELRAFRAFELPWPAAFVILAGVLESAGGALLILGRLIFPTALVLALTMLVAIGASGIGHGDVVPSLTLAPILLAAMILLLLHTRPRLR